MNNPLQATDIAAKELANLLYIDMFIRNRSMTVFNPLLKWALKEGSKTLLTKATPCDCHATAPSTSGATPMPPPPSRPPNLSTCYTRSDSCTAGQIDQDSPNFCRKRLQFQQDGPRPRHSHSSIAFPSRPKSLRTLSSHLSMARCQQRWAKRAFIDRLRCAAVGLGHSAHKRRYWNANATWNIDCWTGTHDIYEGSRPNLEMQKR